MFCTPVSRRLRVYVSVISHIFRGWIFAKILSFVHLGTKGQKGLKVKVTPCCRRVQVSI